MPDLLSETQLLTFEELAALRDYLTDLGEGADRSLRAFHAPGSGGFIYRLDPNTPPVRGDWSKSSTATCIAFLRAVGQLNDAPWASERSVLVREIINSDWDGAKLGNENPYAVAFLLEALADMGGNDILADDEQLVVNDKLDGLEAGLAGDGRIRLQEFGATGFLTFKAVSALRRWGRLHGSTRQMVEEANWIELYRETALVAAGSGDADVFEVIYAVMIASATAPLDQMTPQQRVLLRYGFGLFFEAQHDDGTWPRSRPLFVYPGLGDAYCFDYELLSALLAESQLGSLVYERLTNIRGAVLALDRRKFPLRQATMQTPTSVGWSSGHHGADPRAESWATASALHFAFMVGRLVAEALRRATFQYVGARYSPPHQIDQNTPHLPSTFLDCCITQDGRRGSLKQVLTDRLIVPLAAARDDVARGKALNSFVPSSAILYGPPGTSKTQLARHIAAALGWPLLMLDPSHLTRRGLDKVHAETNTLFDMLQRCEQVVALLDEFDELVREREDAGEIESRFLTTAMLPKLAALSRERRIVYLVATNHLERFDAAIRRPGRFDLIIPVMPPTAAEKLRKWPELGLALEMLRNGPTGADKANETLEDLTFDETVDLVEVLASTNEPVKIAELFESAAQQSTLGQRVSRSHKQEDGGATWKDRIHGQQGRNRGLGHLTLDNTP